MNKGHVETGVHARLAPRTRRGRGRTGYMVTVEDSRTRSDPHGLGFPVQLAINIGVAHDRLHIFAGFGEWNRLHKFLDVAILPY
jgi:hypothetical protein